MARHLADHRLAASGRKTRAFLDIARRLGPHPAVLTLRRKPQAAPDGLRMVQFLRIARGRTV